jgi:hypothetical protein
LRPRALSQREKSSLQKCESIIDSTHIRWQAAWRRKSEREFISRLKQWQHYINDLNQKPDKHIPYYKADVRLRTFISLLTPDLELPDSTYLELLENLDEFLRLNFIPGEFVWNQAGAAAFPRETYWYLWGEPDPVQISLAQED